VSFSEWDRQCMTLALDEARRAATRGEVPVGAVLTRDQQVLANSGNAQIELHDPTAHAEIRVLRDAAVREGNYRLPNTTLYVSLEPCTMCCGALIHARVQTLIFGTREPRSGAVISASQTLDNPLLNHRVQWREGLEETEAAALLRAFFKSAASRAAVCPLQSAVRCDSLAVPVVSTSLRNDEYCRHKSRLVAPRRSQI